MQSTELKKENIQNQIEKSNSVYTYDEVLKSTLEYFKGDELAANVWITKYALKDTNDNYVELNPSDMHIRMAKEFSRIEDKYDVELNGKKSSLSEYGQNREKLNYERILEYFKDFKYIVPQGSVMSMLGNKYKIGSLSNCFVIGQPEDSYGGILYKDEQLVQLMKRRGGVGIDISTLRPDGTAVSNAAKTSTGAISFMERFSNSTREVAQGGRRGALMISISGNYPSVLDFVTIKRDLTKVTGANISVQLSDEFMNAVINNTDYILRFPTTLNINNLDKDFINNLESNKMIEINKNNWIKKVKAKEIWNEIIKSAWMSAEPGLMFQDNHWNYSPDTPYKDFKGVTTNPCITGDSFINTNDGILTMKELVEKVVSGENIEVLTFNEKTKKIENKEVEAGMLTKKYANIIELELEDGSKLKLTPDHKIFTENRGWVEASKLTKDDILIQIE